MFGTRQHTALSVRPKCRSLWQRIAAAACALLLALPMPHALADEAASDEETVRKPLTPAVAQYVIELEDGSWSSSASYAQGATIPFMLEGTLPEDLADLTALPYWLIAEPAAGLTYVAGTAKVALVHANGSSADVTSSLVVGVEGANVVAGSSDLTRSIPDLTATDTLVLSYDVRLNNAVQYGFEHGNASSALLEYRLDRPKKENQASPSPAEATEDSRPLQVAAATSSPTALSGHETGLTASPEARATVYTFRLVLYKTAADTKAALAGASFALRDTLGRWYVRDAEWSTDAAKATAYTTGADGRLTFSGLSVGDYVLVERTAPSGYATVGTVDVNISEAIALATYAADEAAGTEAAQDAASAEASDPDSGDTSSGQIINVPEGGGFAPIHHAMLTAYSAAAEVRSVNADTGTVELGVADPKIGGSTTPAGTTSDSTTKRVVSGYLPTTGDPMRSALPLLLISVLALLCVLALRWHAGRLNTQLAPSPEGRGTDERIQHGTKEV